MWTVRSARFLVGVVLLASPVLCAAQETGTGASAGSGTVVTQPTDTGALLLGRLSSVAEGALALGDLEMTAKERDAWATETKRYAERSAELRSRCNEEIRRANRDTIVSKSAQCLRSDLLLEATHRRKQRDLFESTAGVAPAIAGAAATGIDAWLDASTSIVDGIDAGVFTTVDALKTAKHNLHATYRTPMFHAFVRVRAAHGAAIARGVAGAAYASFDGEPHAVLETFVPCVETAVRLLDATSRDGAGLASGLTQARACIGMLEDAGE